MIARGGGGRQAGVVLLVMAEQGGRTHGGRGRTDAGRDEVEPRRVRRRCGGAVEDGQRSKEAPGGDRVKVGGGGEQGRGRLGRRAAVRVQVRHQVVDAREPLSAVGAARVEPVARVQTGRVGGAAGGEPGERREGSGEGAVAAGGPGREDGRRPGRRGRMRLVVGMTGGAVGAPGAGGTAAAAAAAARGRRAREAPGAARVAARRRLEPRRRRGRGQRSHGGGGGGCTLGRGRRENREAMGGGEVRQEVDGRRLALEGGHCGQVLHRVQTVWIGAAVQRRRGGRRRRRGLGPQIRRRRPRLPGRRRRRRGGLDRRRGAGAPALPLQLGGGGPRGGRYLAG